MRKLSLIATALFLTLVISQIANAAEEKSSGGGRTSDRLGFSLTMGQQPVLSSVGLQIGFNVTNFLRIHGSGGAYFSRSDDAAVAFYNGFFGVIFDTIFGTIIRRAGAEDFSLYADYKYDHAKSKALGASVFLTPWSAWSPAVGVNYGTTDITGRPFGFTQDYSDLVYYSFGVDYQENHAQFGMGIQYIPRAPEGRQFAPYLQAGVYFF